MKDTTFEREIRAVDAPDSVRRLPDIDEDNKEYRDYSQLLDLDFEADQEY